MKKITLLLSAMLFMAVSALADDWTENFDDLSGSYYTGIISLTTGDWEFVSVYPEASTASNNGAHACRINDDTDGASIRTPMLNTIGAVSFYYRELNSGGGTFLVEKSYDNSSWTEVTTQAFSGNSYVEFTYDINDDASTVYVRIVSDDQLGHLIIDDFTVTSYSTGGPDQPAFSNILPEDGNIIDEDSTYIVSATVTTADAGGIDSVLLAYGFESGVLTDTIKLNNVVDSFGVSQVSYEEDTIYYEFIAFGNNGEIKVSPELAVFVKSPVPEFADVMPTSGTIFDVGELFDVSATVTTKKANGVDSVIFMYGDEADQLIYSVKMYQNADTFIYTINIGEEGTKYGQMKAYNFNGKTSMSEIIEVTAVCPYVVAPIATDATDVTPTSFVAHWEASEDAFGYELDVWKEIAATTESDSIFFSEYGEGASGDEKYFEIYNGTADTVFLDGYAHPSVSNTPSTVGVHEFWNTFASGAFIAPGEVYVVVHSSASDSLKAKADELNAFLSNGDDGRALVEGVESDYRVLDWLGDFNGDPGSGWDVAGISSATANHVLVRKPSVSDGNSDWTIASGSDETDSEWIVKGPSDHTDIGSHTMDGAASKNYKLLGSFTDMTSMLVEGLDSDTEYEYAVRALNMYACKSDLSNTIDVMTGVPTSIPQKMDNLVKVFTSTGAITVKAVGDQTVRVYDIAGAQVAKVMMNGESTIQVNRGIYLVRVADEVIKVAVQ